MKYIIMCGGEYVKWQTPRHFCKLKNGEAIISRTIRLLKANGVDDIAISSNNSIFNNLGVPVLHHSNDYGKVKGSLWLDCFYPTTEPVCYIFGDVLFSENAIQTIVKTQTEDIEFFASAPPFSQYYIKNHSEPFAFKVVNLDHFWDSVKTTKKLYIEGTLHRCISWELWEVIKGTPLNKIDHSNYVVINDFTCDVDSPEDIIAINKLIIG